MISKISNWGLVIAGIVLLIYQLNGFFTAGEHDHSNGGLEQYLGEEVLDDNDSSKVLESDKNLKDNHDHLHKHGKPHSH